MIFLVHPLARSTIAIRVTRTLPCSAHIRLEQTFLLLRCGKTLVEGEDMDIDIMTSTGVPA